MKYRPHQIYHVYNQGNNRQPIFFEPDNYLFFLHKVRRYILPLADILCYCLMPNHFHFLLVPNEAASDPGAALKPRSKQMAGTSKVPAIFDRQERLSQNIGTLLSSYTKAVNNRYDRTGSLFRGKTKVKEGWINGVVTIDGPGRHLMFRPENDYARQCFEYIHQNPVKAGMVKEATAWPFSSARDFAGLRNGTLCNKTLTIALLHLK